MPPPGGGASEEGRIGAYYSIVARCYRRIKVALEGRRSMACSTAPVRKRYAAATAIQVVIGRSVGQHEVAQLFAAPCRPYRGS